jgi:hypothetical protein
MSFLADLESTSITPCGHRARGRDQALVRGQTRPKPAHKCMVAERTRREPTAHQVMIGEDERKK